jgi:hypothetical protein
LLASAMPSLSTPLPAPGSIDRMSLSIGAGPENLTARNTQHATSQSQHAAAPARRHVNFKACP